MRILVADDDPTLRLLVTSGLKTLGHEVVACETGAQAWERLKLESFPILVTDWMMPEIDGIQLTELVRRLARRQYTYVIMLTSRGTREDYVDALRAGVDAFLVKPLDPVLLEAQVAIATRILGLQAHARQLESLMTVCSHCKRVRNEGDWVSLPEYVEANYKVRQSHGYCPECFEERVAPELRELGISPEGLKLD